MRRTLPFFLLILLCRGLAPAGPEARIKLPDKLQLVLDSTRPLEYPRGKRLPLYLWPAMDPGDLDPKTALYLVRELNRRGIGLVCSWSWEDRERSLRWGLALARVQKRLGVPVNVNATALLYSLFNGDPRTAHVDDRGRPFFDASFGSDRPMGCPFTLDPRQDEIRERVDGFARAYERAGISPDFVWADWEIDGPIEFNRAHEASLRCQRCRARIPEIGNFLAFQKAIRDLRSDLQRTMFSEPLRARFPRVRVGNYAVHPHDGYRYWYDYFEEYVDGQPYIADRRAKYRLWSNDFPATGYTFAMPVIYPWARLFGWYDFAETDYRWFYNMLLEASGAGRSTPADIPIVSFVHWNPINPEKYPAPGFQPFSAEKYQELLWHMLLRGTDTFYLWCGEKEYGPETRLLHQVYAAAQKYGDFLEKGTPITFDVPGEPGPVISGLKLGNRVLIRRTDFGRRMEPVEVKIGAHKLMVVPDPGRCRIERLDG
jgi:hypothetical protein